MTVLVYDSTKRFIIPSEARLFQDLYELIMNDKWAFLVIWGPQRSGKSTLALWCIYFIWRLIDPSMGENDLWEHVYASVIFNLSQLMYKARDTTQHRIWDRLHHHLRIPGFIWDDFGAHSNKAVTQHEEAWDHFKGGFDVLGTKFGVIIATMTTPEQPTSQIENKYTHEVVITTRGNYKYDEVIWQQDFKGWQARHSKQWQQQSTFQEIPWERFQPYDELRLSLADEVFERIDSAMTEKTPNLLKRLKPEDFKIMEDLIKNGPMSTSEREKNFGSEEGKQVLTRLKAHQLVCPIKRGTAYWIDITNFGVDVFNSYQARSAILAPGLPGELQPSISVGTLSTETPQLAGLINTMNLRKSIKQTLQFQGERVTEGYSDVEPDLVIWRDETTPKEILSVKMTDQQSFNVKDECRKEIEFASKYGFTKIHLIVTDKTKNKVFDSLVSFNEAVNLTPKAQTGEFKVEL